MFKPGLFYIEPSYYENKSIFYHPQALDQFCHAVGKNRFFLLKVSLRIRFDRKTSILATWAYILQYFG